MSFQDPSGDTLTTEGAGIPPLVGYGADSTLNINSGAAGEDAIPTSVTTPPGATPAMETPEPSGAPQNLGTTEGEAAQGESATIVVTEEEIEDLEEASWNLRRAGLVAGVVVASLAAGAGIAWFVISRRRTRQAQFSAIRGARSRQLLRMAPPPARKRLADAMTSSATLTTLARQTAREATALATALAESAATTAQDARERAMIASQMLRDQTLNASQAAQERLSDAQSVVSDTWGRTRDTATTSWDATAETAKIAREAAMRTAKTARKAAQQTAKTARRAAKQTARTARAESKRTAETARAGFNRAQRVAAR